MLLRAVKLPAFTPYSEEVATKATREGWTFGCYLQHLAERVMSRSLLKLSSGRFIATPA